MNRIFGDLAGFEIEIMSTGAVLNAVVRGTIPQIIIPGFDHPAKYSSVPVHALRNLMKTLFSESMSAAEMRYPLANTERLVLLIERAPQDSFYASSSVENKLAGANRRSIPNIAELQSELIERYQLIMVRLEEMPLFEQIYLFSRAWRIVGQHGAGLAHMLWARPDAALVEIVPTRAGVPVEQGENVQFFLGLCQRLGVRWHGVPQRAAHAPVEPSRVLAALDALA